MKNFDTSNLHHYDVGYSALWDKSDFSQVSKKFKKIEQLAEEVKFLNINRLIYQGGFLADGILDEINELKIEKSILVDDFEKQLERNYNDQSSDLEPLQVNKKEDRVVAGGMGRIAEFVVGESIQFFNHYASGTGTTPVYASDTTLVEEVARVSIEQQGYATASGAVIKYGAYFAPNVPTASISEAGVFDAMVNGVMLFRTVFPLEKTINHV